MNAPLHGAVVLDLTQVGPGPHCALLLGDLGADLIKIDSVVSADARPRLVGEGGLFANDWMHYARRNARSIALNLKSEAGQAVLRDLAARADILLESFRPGVMARLGLDFAGLRQINPRLIYCAMSGYGQEGPFRSRAGHDLNYQALGGMLELNGVPGGPPVLPGGLVADFAAGGMQAALGVLAAYIARQRDGVGQQVDVSMQEGIAHLMGPFLAAYLNGGESATRGETYLTGQAPWYNVYATADGRYLAVGAVEPWFFRNLCEAMGHPEWVATHLDRAAWPRLKAEMQAAFRSRSLAEWVELLADRDTCVTAVATLPEVAADPQLQQRGAFIQAEGSWQPAPLLRLSATPGAVRRPPAGYGEHTEAILAELGYNGERRAALRAAGAVQ